MTDNTIFIRISTNPVWRPMRVIFTATVYAGTSMGIIGVGIWAESTAMQWAGFVLLQFCVIGAVAVGVTRESKGRTIAEAREYLDKLEALESPRVTPADLIAVAHALRDKKRGGAA